MSLFVIVCTQPLHPVLHRAGLSLSVAYRLNQSTSGSLQTELALAQSPLEVSTPSLSVFFICSPFLLWSLFYLLPLLAVNLMSFTLFYILAFILMSRYMSVSGLLFLTALGHLPCSSQTLAHVNLKAPHTDTFSPTNYFSRHS